MGREAVTVRAWPNSVLVRGGVCRHSGLDPIDKRVDAGAAALDEQIGASVEPGEVRFLDMTYGHRRAASVEVPADHLVNAIVSCVVPLGRYPGVNTEGPTPIVGPRTVDLDQRCRLVLRFRSQAATGRLGSAPVRVQIQIAEGENAKRAKQE